MEDVLGVWGAWESMGRCEVWGVGVWKYVWGVGNVFGERCGKGVGVGEKDVGKYKVWGVGVWKCVLGVEKCL